MDIPPLWTFRKYRHQLSSAKIIDIRLKETPVVTKNFNFLVPTSLYCFTLSATTHIRLNFKTHLCLKFVLWRVTLRSIRATLGERGGGEPTFPTFLYKNGKLFTWETEIRVTQLAGSLFFDSLVTLLGPTILHVTVWLSQPDQLGSKADTPEGFCSRSTFQALFARVSTHEGAFSSSFNLPREHFAGWKFCSRGWSVPMKSLVHSETLLPECAWSMLREQNPSCVPA